MPAQRRSDSGEGSESRPHDEERPTGAAADQPAQPAGPAAVVPAAVPPPGDPPPAAIANRVEPIKQYLVAVPGAVNKVNQAEFDPLAVEANGRIALTFQNVVAGGAEQSGIRLIAALEGPQSPTGQGNAALPPAQDTIFVAQFTEQGLENFKGNFQTAILAEDVPLDLAQNPSPAAPAAPARPVTYTVQDPGLAPIVGLEDALTVTITVRGGGSPLQNANVYLIGAVFPAQGVTDATGTVTMTIYGERLDTIKVLMVRPKADYWSITIPRPRLVAAPASNDVQVFPINQQQQYQAFPNQLVLGWGQVAMGLDKIPPAMRGKDATGKAVKVAVVDSGVQKDHPNLQVAAGSDIATVLAGQPDTGGWGQDSIGHGSHCAGVIAARDTQHGIRGFAPEAEVHSLKIFPGAQISHLVQALNYCISNNIDVANMSLGVAQLTAEQRHLLEGKIQQAKAAGVACIVAAGNSANAVQYPAALPDVLAVAALGQYGTFPQDSSHGGQIFGDAAPSAAGTGFFSAKFTCFGPEVAQRGVCAPGVAILSTVPAANYAVMDGTSMAAPHVTGLAALILAHHPAFQGQQTRDAQRVEKLFAIIRQSARSLGWPGERQGAGLPSAQQALAPTAVATEPQASPTPPAGGTRADRQRFEADFPGFSHLAVSGPPPDELRRLQVELEELQRLEQQLGGAPVVRPVPAADGRSPALLQLDDVMQSAGLRPGGTPRPAVGAPQTSGLATTPGSPFAAAGTQTAVAPALPAALAGVEPQFLESFLRDQVYDMIQKLYRYVRQYSQLADCTPLVSTTVQQFGQGQYTKALASGYQAFNCIQARLR